MAGESQQAVIASQNSFFSQSGPKRGGPYVSSGGDFYVIVPGAVASPHRIEIWKASSVSGTWALEVSLPIAASGEIAWDCVQDGDDLHIALTSPVSKSLEFRTFDMSTDTWVASLLEIEQDTDWSTSADESVSITISQGSTKYLCICHGSFQVRIMGTWYKKLHTWKRTLSGGSWSAGPTLVSESTEVNVFSSLQAVGEAEFVHVAYRAQDDGPTSDDIYFRSWRPSDNTTSTEISITASTSSGIGMKAIGYKATDFEVRFLYTRGQVTTDDLMVFNLYEDGSDHIAARTTEETGGQDWGDLSSSKDSDLVYDPTTDKEYLIYTEHYISDSGVSYRSRDGASTGAFSSETTFDTSENWSFIAGLAPVDRDGSTYLDVVVFNEGTTDEWTYWELLELAAAGLALPPSAPRQMMQTNVNLRR